MHLRTRHEPAHRKPPGYGGLILTALMAVVLAAGTVMALTSRAPAVRAARQAPAATAIPAALAPASWRHPAARALPPATAVPRTYTVRPGDTLSVIALRYCGNPAAWPALARASRIADGNMIMPGWRVTLACGAVTPRPAAAARDGDGDYDHDVSDAPARTAGGLSGTLSWSGLMALWDAAGGAHWAASTAACIAEHESGGRQYATGAAGERGYWQISPDHGYLSSYDPMTNARAAIIISGNGTDWARDWTTHVYCGVSEITGPARAAAVTLAGYYESPGARALDYAEFHYNNKPYAWGGAGPYSFDCSGLVMEAVLHADGIWLPHNAELIRENWHLYRIPLAAAQRGDLLFWLDPGGYAYHIAFNTRWYRTDYGAENYGWDGRVTWHPWWGTPVAYHLR